MKKLIGKLMLAAPFVGLFWLDALDLGLLRTIALFAVVSVGLLFIFVGVTLACGNPRKPIAFSGIVERLDTTKKNELKEDAESLDQAVRALREQEERTKVELQERFSKLKAFRDPGQMFRHAGVDFVVENYFEGFYENPFFIAAYRAEDGRLLRERFDLTMLPALIAQNS